MNGFRPARRSEAKPLIGLYAESGAGKTWSSLLLARGFVGPNGKIGMIETEGGRGEAYVGRPPVGDYLVYPIRQNFSPQEYGKAITEAENTKLDALIIDSASAEWEGTGGVLAMAAANQAAGKKGVLIWQIPKVDHARHFMLRLMQTPIPLVIVAMRARFPMEQRGSEWVRSTKLEPKQSDDILYEMMVHAWLDQEHVCHVTKYTLPELEKVIINGQLIDINTGVRLAAWARSELAEPARPSSGPDRESQGARPLTGPGREARPPLTLQAPEPVPATGPAGRTPPASTDASQAAGGAAPLTLQDEAREAAKRGEETFRAFWRRLIPAQRDAVQVIADELRVLLDEAKKENAS